MEFEKTYNNSLIFIPEDPHMVKTENFEKVEITTQDQLREWLVAPHLVCWDCELTTHMISY